MPPTNYPTSLDDNLTLGALFTNSSAVTNPVTQIDATYRVNIKDAVLAVEARLGVDDSTVPTSLSWATLSVGGTPNQGLRFSTSSAAWPGLVAEAGIFVDSATGYAVYHYQGDALNVFYPLTAAGSIVSLQNAYNTSGVLTTSGTDDLAFTVVAGDDFTVACGIGAAVKLTGAASTLTSGLLDIDCTAIGATDVTAANIRTENSTNNQEFGVVLGVVNNTGDLATTEIVYSHGASLTMGGDGPAVGRAFGAGFYAKSSAFTGANVYTSAGLLVDSTFDYGVWSNSGIMVDMAAADPAILVDSDPSVGESTCALANVGTSNSAFFTCYAGTLGTPTATRFNILNSGKTDIIADTSGTALVVQQIGAGRLFRCLDPASAVLLSVAHDGATEIAATAASTAATLTLTHGAATEPFIDFNGTYAALKANGNVTDNDTGGVVVGPGTNIWTFQGMAKVELGPGALGMAGDYWIALYN